MDEDHLRALVGPEVYDRFRMVLIGALQRAYDVAREAHGRDPGFDALTFGVMVWRLSWYHAERDLRAAGFKVERPNNSLVIIVGSFAVHLYRAGDNVGFDIDRDFGFLTGTPTKESISTENARQLQLFGTDVGLELPVHHPCTQLVVAHTGNPDSSLCAAWLGAPLTSDSGVSWAWVTEIFSTAPAELDFLPPPPPVPSPNSAATYVPFSEQPEPHLELGRIDRDQPGAAKS